jgi:uncharacterized protein (UPF0333 family)
MCVCVCVCVCVSMAQQAQGLLLLIIIIIIIIIITYLFIYLLQLSCHSVAVVLTPVQTKQIRINTHKRNNTKKTVHIIQNTVNTSTHITETPT